MCGEREIERLIDCCRALFDLEVIQIALDSGGVSDCVRFGSSSEIQ